jgi:glucosamine kinase
MRCVLGFDGGGTKTDCVLMDETQSIRARARCGPCNPVLVGEQAAANALLASGEEACAAAGALPEEVLFISGGVAGMGAGRGFPQVVEKLQTKFVNAHVSLLSDLAMALAATRETPSVVVIAGTGSSVYGRDANGATAREGGLGAILGDPGSAYDIGRKAMVEELRHELDANSSALRNQILQHFACSWPELQEKLRANPVNVLPRIFPLVVEAANGGEATAQELLRSSAVELAALGERVVAKLKLQFSWPSLAGYSGVARTLTRHSTTGYALSRHWHVWPACLRPSRNMPRAARQDIWRDPCDGPGASSWMSNSKRIAKRRARLLANSSPGCYIIRISKCWFCCSRILRWTNRSYARC